ncbi:hypothetical protein BC567DRAFT_15616 [Phyllosticta citribraziliensis]
MLRSIPHTQTAVTVTVAGAARQRGKSNHLVSYHFVSSRLVPLPLLTHAVSLEARCLRRRPQPSHTPRPQPSKLVRRRRCCPSALLHAATAVQASPAQRSPAKSGPAKSGAARRRGRSGCEVDVYGCAALLHEDGHPSRRPPPHCTRCAALRCVAL